MAETPNALRINFFRNAIGFIMLAYAIIFFLVKSPNDPYDRLIINDGKAYYAYLPALFIYQDLQFGFIEYYESKYYPSDAEPSYFKEFRFQFRGQTVNKAFAGIAVLILPFFLLAHVLALLFGDPDGYSMIYQYAIGLSAYFYLWLGLLTLKRLLGCFTGSTQTKSIVLIAIALGTNLVYYTVVEGTMPHVYLFFLVNLFLLLSYRALHERHGFHFMGAAAVFGFILIVRPQNGFVILALPFLAGSLKKFRSAIVFFFRENFLWLKSIITLLSVLMLQIAIWYAQTGYFLVYSYGDEIFNFLNPQIVSILWSYEKGWMLYTPLAFLAIAGMLKTFRINVGAAVSVAFTFLFLTYVFSCWWVWHYTSQFGQRVFIDFYGLLAVLLLMGFDLFRNMAYRNFYQLLIIFLILLNLFQFYQHITWVYPAGPVNAKTYWGNFFNIRPQSGASIPDEAVSERKIFTFPATSGFDYASENTAVLQTQHNLTPYRTSPLFSLVYGEYMSSDPLLINVKSEIFGCADSALNLQFDFYSSGEKNSEHIVQTNRFLRCNRMNQVEAVVFLPLSFDRNDSVSVSLVSPSFMEVRTGKQTAELIIIEPETELRWIPKPLNSVISKNSFYCNMADCIELFRLSSVSKEVSRTGGVSSKVDKQHPFGPGIRLHPEDVFQGGNTAVRMSAYTFAEEDVKAGHLVLSIGSEDKLLLYKSFELSFAAGLWTFNEFVTALPPHAGDGRELRIYFWDPEPEQAWFIDDFRVDFLTLKDRYISPATQRKKQDAEHTLLSALPDTVVMYHRNPFYGPPPVLLAEINHCQSFVMVLEAEVLSDCWFPSSAMIVGHYHGDSLINYQAHYFSTSVQKGRCSNIVHEFAIGECVTAEDELKIYFWNPSPDEKLMVSDFKIYMRMNR